jgi:hypothetical protein
MTAQLDELAKLATAASNLRIDTIPWTQPLSRPLMSGFRLFDRTVLAVSSEIGEVFIEDPTEGRNERPVRPAHRVGRLRRGCCRDRTANRGRLQEPVTADGRRQPRGSVQYNHRVGLVKGVEEHPARDPVLRWRTGRVAGRISHTASQTALGARSKSILAPPDHRSVPRKAGRPHSANSRGI